MRYIFQSDFMVRVVHGGKDSYFNIIVLLLIFFVILPISLGFDGDSIVFHSTYLSSWKALPIGLVLLIPFLIYNAKNILLINYRLFVVILLSSSCSYYFGKDVRTVVVAAQIVLMISLTDIFVSIFEKTKLNIETIFQYLFFIVASVIFAKFITDVHYYYGYYLYHSHKVSIFLVGDGWNFLSGLYQNPFSNPAFLNKQLLIYDFYDYFQLIYIFGLYLSYKVCRKYPLLSCLLISVVMLYMYYSTSRLWQITVLCFPFIVLASRLRIEFKYYFLMSMMLWVLVVATGYFLKGQITTGRSLGLRMNLIAELFNNMSVTKFFFPILDKGISAADKSMHNEFLEVWYRCGIFTAIMFWVWAYGKLSAIYRSDRMLSVLLLFILMAGGLIQLNYIHIYSMLLLSIFYAAVLCQKRPHGNDDI